MASSLRRTAIEALDVRKPIAIDLGGVAVAEYSLRLSAWRGTRPHSNAEDCRKGSALVTAPDGSMSCTEVEVVRRLRLAGMEAGWVQAWSCGRDRWSDSIWSRLPVAVASRNATIQSRLGRRESALGGHPDVALIATDELFYVECKTTDTIDKQLAWIETGVALGILDSDHVIVVRGVIG